MVNEVKMRKEYAKVKLKSVKVSKTEEALVKAVKEFERKRDEFGRSHNVLYTFIAGTGLIMFWYGIWEGIRMIPILGHPLVSIGVGGVILLLCGAYAYQLLGGKAAIIQEEFDDVSQNVGEITEMVDEVSDKVDDLHRQAMASPLKARIDVNIHTK